MAEVLSQAEIDALLSAVGTGSIDTAPAQTEEQERVNWIAYDLASQAEVMRGRLAALEGIHDRFARLFRETLATAVKKNVSITLTNTDFMKFGEYVTNIMLPTSLNILSVPALSGSVVMMVSSKLAYALIDAYYGGSERPFAKMGGREQFTTIESNMIMKVCTRAISDLEEAWKPSYPIKFEYLRTETNPQFIGSIHASENVAIVNFDVALENLSGPLILIIPLKPFDTIQKQLSVNVTNDAVVDSSEWKNHWMHELMTLGLDVRVELGYVAKALNEVRSFQVGDVLTLNQDAVSPLAVRVEGMNKYYGLMGAYHGNTAVRIIDISEHESK